MSEIRPAEPEDLTAVAHMKAAAWRETYAHLLPADMIEAQSAPERITNAVSLWARSLAAGDPFWVAVRDGEITGVIHVCAARDADATAARELAMLYLRDAEKGTGLSDRLMGVAVGETPCVLWVLEANERAVRFYRRHGFVPDGAVKHVAGLQEIRMVRTLSRAD